MIAPLIMTPFTGILCLFLLSLGLSAGQGLIQNRHLLSGGLFAFGVICHGPGLRWPRHSASPLDFKQAAISC